MKRSHWMSAAVFALAAFAPAAWAAPVPAESSALSWVPATAPVVAHLNGLDLLRDHVAAFLKNALPGQGDALLTQYDSLMKNGVQGRKIRGLSKDGPIFLVITDLNASPDSAALIAAVSDYAAFRDNILSDDEKKALKTENGVETTLIGPLPVYFVDKKEYVVVTPSKDLAASYAKRESGAAAGLDGKLSKAQAAKFLAGDAGYYVDMEAIDKQFADQIKAARKQFEATMDQAALAAGPEQKTQFELGKKIFSSLFQAVEDAKAALATVEIHPDGAAVHIDVETRSGTETADLLKGFKPATFKDLGKLPAGDVFYAGVAIDPAMLKLMQSMMSSLSGDPKYKDLAAAYDDLAKAGPTTAISAVTYPAAGLSITTCADPDKAVAASTKVIQSMGAGGGFGNVAFKEKPEVKANAEKYNDVSFTSIHMVWDFDKMMAAGGATLPDATRKQLIEGMKKLLGEEVTSWIGSDGKALIQVTAKDWDEAKTILDAYTKGTGAVGADAGFAAARKQLPDQATALVLIDAALAGERILDFAKPLLQSSGTTLPPNYPAAAKGKSGFVGFSLTLRSEGGAIDMVVTADAVRQVYQGYIAPLMPAPH